MTNITQKQWVLQKLKEDGYITRNQCLRNYISRLGAIIADLKADGYEFKTCYVDVERPFGMGKDYKYILI